MEKLRKFGSKLTGRNSRSTHGANGKKSGRDRTLRYSRSMPLRSSSDTGANSEGLVLDIRPMDGPKILDELGYTRQKHHENCDCWDCEHPDLLGQFPAPPPMRPKTRPPPMEQLFDDIQILPDEVDEKRKRLREKGRQEAEERQQILEGVLALRARLESGDSTAFSEAADHLKSSLFFRQPNLSTQSLGSRAHYRHGPVAHRPIVRKASVITVASSHPRLETPLSSGTPQQSASHSTAPLRLRSERHRPHAAPHGRDRNGAPVSEEVRRRLLSNPRRLATAQNYTSPPVSQRTLAGIRHAQSKSDPLPYSTSQLN